MINKYTKFFFKYIWKNRIKKINKKKKKK
jgi:hypothetical protein